MIPWQLLDRRSHSRTVLSSEQEMNMSFTGDTCRETTLCVRETEGRGGEWRGGEGKGGEGSLVCVFLCMYICVRVSVCVCVRVRACVWPWKIEV